MADPPQPPTLTVFAGPNGAGKSTLYRALSLESTDFGPAVNVDDIAARLPADTKNRELTAGRQAIAEARAHLATRRSFTQETTLTGRFPLRLMRDAKAAGYQVNLVYIGVRALKIAQRRVADRVGFGGHDIPEADQARRFARSQANIAAAARTADNAALLDNSSHSKAYTLVADVERGRVRSVADDAPRWTLEAIEQLPRSPDPIAAWRSFAERLAAEAAALDRLAREPFTEDRGEPEG